MTEKNKGGRPPISLTDEQVSQTEALGAVLSIEQIADYFGIGKTTFYAIMERQPEVGERYKKGKAKAIGAVAQGLLQQARNGNTTAAMFYLKTQAGWREKSETTININKSKDIKELSDEELFEIVENSKNKKNP